jgi:transposase-like protein
MPRPLPAEFRLRAVALVRAGKTITRTAEELGVSQAALHNWVRQDKIDRGELPGVSTKESAELKKAKRRIRELEMEVEILRQAAKLLGDDRPHPKGFTR